MFGQHNLHAHLGGALQDRVKVVHFKPEQDAVSIGLVIAVANPPMVVFHFEAVQLKDQLAIGNQLLVMGTSMKTPAAQQSLVPSAAGFHVGYCDERLRSHSGTITRSQMANRA